MTNNYKVLVLDGDPAHSVAIMECLKKTGFETAVLCHDKMSYGYHSHLADKKFLGPDSHEHDTYWFFLKDFLEEHHYDVLIPTSDSAAECMSIHSDELSGLTNVLMPPKHVFDKAYDKNKLMELCRDKGYPHPKTLDLSNRNTDDIAIRQFPYPALIKPNITSGARGMTLVKNHEEFIAVYDNIHRTYGECHLQQFIPEGGRQIKIQLFTDRNSDVLYSSAIWKQRFYPVRGGSSCCNVTINQPEVTAACASILKDINWVGFADFDLIEDPRTHQLLIMEINPRIPACIRSVFKSGIDYATIIANASLNLPNKKYQYNSGKKLRHIGFDVLWFLKSPDRFHSKPSWFNFFSRNTYYQDFIGYGVASFLYGTIGNIKKILNPDFRKAKSGV